MLTIEANPAGALRTVSVRKREYDMRGGVLADGPGMGKTATLLGLILSEPKFASLGCNLVVVPPHLCLQWQSEIRCGDPDPGPMSSGL